MTAAHKISITPDALRKSIRQAAMRVPAHRIHEEVLRELQNGVDEDDIQLTDIDMHRARHALLRGRGR